MIENCMDPPVYFTHNGVGINNVTWDEPGFYDNSKAPVQLKQNYLSGESAFPIGTTEVVYNAIDKYDNRATCVLNITIKGMRLTTDTRFLSNMLEIIEYRLLPWLLDVCKEIPKVLNGYSNCSSTTANGTSECTVACDEGFGFATEVPNLRAVEDVLLLKCNTSNVNWTEENYIPDCSGAFTLCEVCV